MKKTFKRLAALAMSLALTAALAAPGFAAEESQAGGNNPTQIGYGVGDIQIGHAAQGTYKAYQLLDVAVLPAGSQLEDGTTSTEPTYVYYFKDSSPWADFFLTGAGAGYLTSTAEEEGEELQNGEPVPYTLYSVSWKENMETDDATVQKFAQAAAVYAEANSIEPQGSTVYEGVGDAGVATISEVRYGYYLVTSTGGSLCMTGTLCSRDPLILDDKQVTATLVKEVWEDRYSADKNSGPTERQYFQAGSRTPNRGTGGASAHGQISGLVPVSSTKGWSVTNDAEIGETVWYRATITAGGNATNYTMLDYMYPGLTPNEDSVRVFRSDPSTESGYAEVQKEDANFTVAFDPSWATAGSIRDTDMADEMMNYTKDNIMTQSGTAALSDGENGNDGIDTQMIIKKNINALNGVGKLSETNCTFAVRFTDDFCATLKEGDKLVIIYTAVLNKDAIVSPNGGNDNIALLGYGKGTLGIADYNEGKTNILQQAQNAMLAQAGGNNQSVLQSDDIPVDDAFSVAPQSEDDGIEVQVMSSGGKINRAADDAAGVGISEKIRLALTGYRGFTLASVTTTYTYPLDLVKVDGYNNVLSGAKFTLQRVNSDNSTTDIALVPYQTPNTQWANWSATQTTLPIFQLLQDGGDIAGDWAYDRRDFRPAMPGERGAITVFEAGVTCFHGLDDGIYQLEEIEAPAGGYNKLKEPIVFKVESQSGAAESLADAESQIRDNTDMAEEMAQAITSNGNSEKLSSGYKINRAGDDAQELSGLAKLRLRVESVSAMGLPTYTYSDPTGLTIQWEDNDLVGQLYVQGTGGLAVVNNIGNELPHTGGMGTTLFYAMGAVLVAGAGILLIARKRMSYEEL